MAEDTDRKPTPSAAGRRAAEQRRLRLAAALRENLRKRKAQERARSDAFGALDPGRSDKEQPGGRRLETAARLK